MKRVLENREILNLTFDKDAKINSVKKGAILNKKRYAGPFANG